MLKLLKALGKSMFKDGAKSSYLGKKNFHVALPNCWDGVFLIAMSKMLGFFCTN
jgi:hypothetical protein